MNRVVEGRVRLYLIGLMIAMIVVGAGGGFMWVEEVKTQGYYFEIKASHDNDYADLKHHENL